MSEIGVVATVMSILLSTIALAKYWKPIYKFSCSFYVKKQMRSKNRKREKEGTRPRVDYRDRRDLREGNRSSLSVRGRVVTREDILRWDELDAEPKHFKSCGHVALTLSREDRFRHTGWL